MFGTVPWGELALAGVDVSPDYVLEHYPNVTRLVFAAALGMLLGTEREWSQKPAGTRTFTIITTLAAVMVVAEEPALLLLGGALVVIQGSVFAFRGLITGDESYLLTTSVSMILAYGVGVLVGKGYFLEGVIIAVITTFLLVLRRELHGFARKLSKDEIRSAIEFAILAFVIYPLLPNQPLDPWGAVNPGRCGCWSSPSAASGSRTTSSSSATGPAVSPSRASSAAW
ncbi:MgtC/SapB family protein [Haloarculaceae archaeon H-GB2-1]|nr:MgtC/SapB family protein [Haloarculaceae archaeon H-GB2-1]